MTDRKRILLFLGIVVAGVVAAVAFSLSYPFSYDQQATAPDLDVEPPASSTYEIEATFTVTADDELTQQRSLAFVADGDDVLERVHDDPTPDDRAERTTNYYRTDEAWTSTRMWTDDEETMESWLEYEDEVVAREESDDEYVLVVAEETDDDAAARFEQFYTHVVAVPAVGMPDYEKRGEETFAGRTVEVYEPQEGWYESVAFSHTFEEYRVLDAEGELYVDPESGILVYADLSYTVVEASNLAEYVHARWYVDEVMTIDVTYAFDDDGEVEKPDWAEAPE